MANRIGDFLLKHGVSSDAIADAINTQHTNRMSGMIPRPIGQLLLSNRTIDKDTLAAAVRDLEMDRLSHLDPMTQFALSTKFGRRLQQQANEKKAVAISAAARFGKPHSRLFIADGTSGFYAFLAVVKQFCSKSTFHICTNSLAIAMEHSQSTAVAKNVSLELCGRVPVHTIETNDSMALRGLTSAETEIRQSCKDITTILPLSGISFDEGPYAQSDQIRCIKRAIMESAAHVVFVVDHSKFASPGEHRRNDFQLPVYENPKDWNNWRNEHYWSLISTIPNELIVDPFPRDSLLCYESNGVLKHKAGLDYAAKQKANRYLTEAAHFHALNKSNRNRFLEVIRPINEE